MGFVTAPEITPTPSSGTMTTRGGKIANPDVKLAFDAIRAKKPLYDDLYRYYEGFQPLRYSTKKLHETFDTINVYFAQNWLAVIVDSVLDRLQLKGFDVSEDQASNDILDEIWQEQNLSLIAEDVHESASITGEAFVIVLPAENNSEEQSEGETIDIYHNDPRMCHVFYEPDNPNEKRFAAKVWVDQNRYFCLTLYYKDHFEYYKSNRQIKSATAYGYPTNLDVSFSQLMPDPDLPTEDNPFNEIPVFHFRSSRTTRKREMGPSEVSLQDAINKILSDMMISSEFSAYTQRVIISAEDPGNMQNKPNANWWVPAGDSSSQPTQVFELGGKSLDGFLTAIDKLAGSLAIISRTPKHYFFQQGGDPSGEALLALEAPLNKKVKKRQNRYTVEWKCFAAFLLALQGNEVDKNSIVTLWEPAETIQPKTLAEITESDVKAGVPLITSKRRQGWSQEEIEQMQEDQQDEQKKKTGLAQAALDELRAQDAQNNAYPGKDVNKDLPMQPSVNSSSANTPANTALSGTTQPASNQTSLNG